MALLALLLGTLTSFLISMFRGANQASVRNHLQTEGLLYSEEILKVLRSTGQPGLSLHVDPAGAAFAAVPLKTTTSTGQKVWDDNLKLYYWRSAEQTLMRKRCPPLPLSVVVAFRPESPPQLDPSQFAALTTNDGRLLSDKVTNFEISESEAFVRFRLDLRQAVPNGRDETYSVIRKLSFKS